MPAGAVWYDFWTNEKIEGGQEIAKKTNINTIPVYIKSGSILPIGPKVQYAEEKKWDNFEIRIYPGADGEFTLYEDEGDNYNYEKGAYSTIKFSWNDAEKTLTIGERKGSFSGMLTNRKFNIVVVNENNNTKMNTAVYFDKTVAYNGETVSIK